MASRKPSGGGSGCLSIVAVVGAICVLCAMCGIGGDETDNPAASSTPTASISITNPVSDPTTEPTVTEPAPTQTEPASTETEPAPTEPPATQSATIEFISWPETIARGNTVTVKIKGEPNTKYSITVYYKSGAATAEGLESKTSDADGYVTWTWKVGGRTSPGTFRITVSGGGVSETVYFTVTE